MNINPLSRAKSYAQMLCDDLHMAMHTDEGWFRTYWAGEAIKKISAMRVALLDAEAELAAHIRLKQAAPDGTGGWTYRGLSGLWRISRDPVRGTVFLAQHDEVTGDDDPAWMFADGSDLTACMDAIDATEEENGCFKCFAMVGSENLTEAGPDAWLCPDCAQAEAERERGMAEMAADDKAHAAMERRAGL